MRTLLKVILPLLVLSACTTDTGGSDTDPALATGVWRAEVQQDEVTIPFNFSVTEAENGYAVTYLNGPERMPVEQVVLDGDQLQLNFPSYSSGLTATVTADMMSGTISLARKNRSIELPFTARHGFSHRFFAEPATEFADFGGRWQVEITVPQFDFTQPAVAIFEQSAAELTGTVNTQVGDYRFLHGEVRGDELFLSTFDGSGTQLWTAKRQPDGSLRGNFTSVTYGSAEWTAVRNADFKLEDPTKLTVMKPGYETLEFSLPDLDGNRVSLADPQYEDKVVIVVLGGSWCPSCHDEAQFMVPFLQEYADTDLEVIYIMFEYSDDFSEAEEQLRAYQARYGIEHPILFAGESARSSRADKLTMLNDIMAFPTTLFVDRSGAVRRIHTAFPGPATGQEHEDYKREFRAFVDMLLAETA